MVYEKKCVVCGKKFTTNRSLQICCSSECSSSRNKEKDRNSEARRRVFGKRSFKKRLCPFCGLWFVPKHYNQRFCCHDHQQRSLLIQDRTTTCRVCGKVFEFHHTRKELCSEECRSKQRSANAAGWKKRNPERSKAIQRACEARRPKRPDNRTKEENAARAKAYYHEKAKDPRFLKRMSEKTKSYRKRGLLDFLADVDSKASRWYMRACERSSAWARDNRYRISRKEADKKLADANGNNAAIWLSLGIYE